ncbi:hypothetical protein HPB49_013906 [Dermacentor silvarum]|uniref:Uncharacterized protein n=1 Tax=Dermacentor silvarum TaxID=543639 RepID=A0ACB8DDE8_DERSI|nr:hypothetical protein HPB49_013906 [Dermacentor silvarum]
MLKGKSTPVIKFRKQLARSLFGPRQDKFEESRGRKLVHTLKKIGGSARNARRRCTGCYAAINTSSSPNEARGFRAMCEKGCLTGHKIAGVRFRLTDGDNHMVDSNDISFFLAAQGAIKQVYQYGSWYLLEPIMMVEVTAPDEFQGSVLSSLSKRQGVIVSTDASEGWFTVMVEASHTFLDLPYEYTLVPLNSMFGYSTELRSMTQGKGEFTMEYSRYSPARPEVQQQLVEEYRADQEAAAAAAAGGGKKRR